MHIFPSYDFVVWLLQLALLICVDLSTFTRGSNPLTLKGGSFASGAILDLDIFEAEVPVDKPQR